MVVHCIFGQGYDSNIYIITGRKTTIVDTGTGMHFEQLMSEIREIIDPNEVQQIIITHEHFDHCGGVRKLHDVINHGVSVMAHVDASDKIEKGDSDFARMLGGVMPKMPVDVKLKEGDTVEIGDETYGVIHTPGHSPGSMCLYGEKSKTLFSGDTIFSHGSFGRYDFPGGDAGLLKNSIERLSKLDVEYLYPGHESIVEGDGNRHIGMSLRNTSFLM